MRSNKRSPATVILRDPAVAEVGHRVRLLALGHGVTHVKLPDAGEIATCPAGSGAR